MAFTIGTATFTNGSSSVTNVSLTSGRLSYFSSGTRIVVGTNPVVAEVEAIDAPAVNAITLREPWGFATGTYAFLANMTSEGVRDAVQTIRESTETLQQFMDSIEVNPVADSVVQRTANGRVKTANATESNDAVALGQLGTAATRNVGTGSEDVMEVGAWNWGHMRTPSEGLDFNDFGNRNLYPASGASYLYSTQNQNGPTTAGTHVLTMKLSDGYLAQLGIQHSGRTYVRGVADEFIGDWRELISTGNILASTGQSTQYPMSQKAVTDALNTKANTSSLGTAATRNVGTGSEDVMEVGAGGWLGKGQLSSTYTPPTQASDNITEVIYSTSSYSVGEHSMLAWHPILKLAASNNVYTHILTSNSSTPSAGNAKIVMVNGHADNNLSSAVELFHTGNILTTTGQSTAFPMSQKAVTDAINGISDERDKTEINEIGLGLEVIENLKPVSFKLNKRDWYRQEAAKELIEVEEDGRITTQEKINYDVLNSPLSDFEENDGSLKRDDVYTGFVAQDLRDTLEELGLGHLGIVKNYAEEYEGGEDRFYIEHLALLPFLVNSIKQLSARVKALEGGQDGEVE